MLFLVRVGEVTEFEYAQQLHVLNSKVLNPQGCIITWFFFLSKISDVQSGL